MVTEIDLVRDVGLSGGQLNGNVDVTHILYGPDTDSGTVEWHCKTAGVKKVTMPDECRLKVSRQSATWADAFPTTDPRYDRIYTSKYAQSWIGNFGTWGADDGSRVILDVLSPAFARYVTGKAILTMIEWDNFRNAQMKFRLDTQAAAQMAAFNQADHNSAGEIVGFAVNGIRSSGQIDPDVQMSFLNHRSRNASGYGSAFCLEMIQGVRGNFDVEFDIQDGSFGSECIVFHGYTFSSPNDDWLLNRVRSRRMWRGWGCFNGGRGIVRDVQTFDLHPPGGTTSNIEAGLDKTDSAGHVIAQGGTPGPIVLHAPQSTNGGIFLNINNNYGNKVGNVQLLGGSSTKDATCITLTGVMGQSAGAPGDGQPVGLYCSDAFFDTPDSVLLKLQSGAVATDVRMTRCKYKPSTIKKVSSGAVPSAWDLTFGSGGNVKPTCSNITPVDGTTVPASTAVTVACECSDDHDTPTSGLSAVGQVYLPAVNVTSITVSGTTATLVGAAAVNATVGKQVRIKGNSAGLNGSHTVVAISTTNVANDTITFAVASGTPSANGGTVEPFGTTLTMTARTDGKVGFTSTWTTPSTQGAARRIEIVVTDSGNLPSDPIGTNVTVTSNNPPLVALLAPQPNQLVNNAAGQSIKACVIDPNVGDTITAASYAIKDDSGTVLSGPLASGAPGVDTTLAADVADVSQLNGDATDIVQLTSAAGAVAPGVVAAVQGGKLVVLAFGGKSGNNLTYVETLIGSGALTSGVKVRSANYSATVDTSSLTAGASYIAQANATDNHSALGASDPVSFKINTPPQVSWTFPVARQTVRGTITLVVTVIDDGGSVTCTGELRNMDAGGAGVHVGNFAVDSDGNVTYSNFDTTTLSSPGDHTLRAIITDANGAITSADVTFHVDQAVDTTGPTITSVTLSDGQVITGPIDFTAQITDASGVLNVTVQIEAPDGTIINIPMQEGS